MCYGVVLKCFGVVWGVSMVPFYTNLLNLISPY